MRISVLIPTYNRCQAVLRTLEHLLGQGGCLKDTEALVLDDNGVDGTFQELSRRRAQYITRGLRDFRVFRNERNMGAAYNRNFLGIKAASPDYLLYLDDDVYMRPGTLERLLLCLVKAPERALAGPRLLYAADPARTAHCANFVGRWSGRYSESDATVETECDWLNSSCLLARASAALGCGGWAEDLFISHEEVDFCLKLKRVGWKIVYCPEAGAEHDLPVQKGARRERLYYLYRNKILVLRRNLPALRCVTATLTFAFLGFPRYVIESLGFNRGADPRELLLIFKAVLHGLTGRSGRL